MNDTSLTLLIDGFRRGERRALAKIITLVESTAISDMNSAHTILRQMQGARETVRVAISGPPGVGKSTFINTLGKKILARGFRLAILPIDPSSELNLGSILADKTRMKDLLSSDDVYVRPSPSKGALGGMAFATHDVLFVVEAFGFNFIIVETVGVGQSEMMASSLTDHFVLLMQPGSGDALQAMKKGIIERADFILVNKADGAQHEFAKKTLAPLKALAHQQADRTLYVDSISALHDDGVDRFFGVLIARHHALNQSGKIAVTRHERQLKLFLQLFADQCARTLRETPALINRCEQAVHDVACHQGAMGPAVTKVVADVIKKLLP